MKSIKDSFRTPGTPEITLEVNPDTVNLEKLKGFRDNGVNRLSIGLQALSETHLKTLGRTHTVQRALDAFKEARAAGFENIGVDLIFGIPGQTVKEWEDALSKVAGLKPEHISLYGLTIEEGTPFYPLYGTGRGREMLPGEAAETQMYRSAIKLLTEGGWRHYEISNFARPGFESVHNSGYWLGVDYIGLGVSAHSYLSSPGWGRRWWNTPDIEGYMREVELHGRAVEASEDLGRGEAMLEAVMLGLRMIEKGIDGERFRAMFDAYPAEALKGVDKLVKEGFLRMRGEDVLLTEKGVLLSNEVFLELMG